MKNSLLASTLLAAACLAAPVMAAPAALKVSLQGITPNQPIAERFAYCKPNGKGATVDGGNINPAINWTGAPATTKSFAIIVVDGDVPASFDDANKPGKTIASDFPRQDFYHWVMTDIPAGTTAIAEGKNSNGIIKTGKKTGDKGYGIDHANSYGFGGYDGPCPPWNDERLHHYRFMVYALDVPSLALAHDAKGQEVVKLLAAHTLASGETSGTFTTNPKVRNAVK